MKTKEDTDGRNKLGRFVKGRKNENKRVDIKRSIVIKLYNEDKLSSIKIAKKLDCSKTVILRILRENKINMRKGLGLNEEEIIKLYCEDKISPNKIVKNLNGSMQPVYSILRKRNLISKEVLLKVRKEIPAHNKINFSDKDTKKIIYLYQNKKKTANKISKIFLVRTQPIYRILKENGIKRRRRKYYLDEKEIVEKYKQIKSVNEIAKKYNCDSKVILRILRINNIDLTKYKKPSSIKGLTLEKFHGEKKGKEIRKKMKEHRATQIFPLKDSKIELKIQDFLTLLKIEFLTHKYMNIKNGYQCDVFIPVQEGIPQKIVIECDGDFFHCNPNKYSEDFVLFPNTKNTKTAKERWKLDDSRTNQLIEKGFKVIRIWEHEIKVMELNEFKGILNA